MLCRCGCGKETSMVTRNRSKQGLVKGTYRTFVVGHQNRGLHNGKAIRPYESLYLLLLKKAKRRKISVEFSYEDFIEFTKISYCHYCGDLIKWEPYNMLHRYNLDRRISSLGYTKENCVVCCKVCNCAKRTMSDGEFKEWIFRTYEHLKGRG